MLSPLFHYGIGKEPKNAYWLAWITIERTWFGYEKSYTFFIQEVVSVTFDTTSWNT